MNIFYSLTLFSFFIFGITGKIQTSGMETSRALITLHEDPTSHDGIQSYLRFAVFLELPFTSPSKSFEAELSIHANTAGDNVSSGIRRLLGSPYVIRSVLLYL